MEAVHKMVQETVLTDQLIYERTYRKKYLVANADGD